MFYSFPWMYRIIPFAIVYFIYLKIPALVDDGHHMTNYGLFGRYIDLFSFLVFPVCLGCLFFLHSKTTCPRSFVTFGSNNLRFYVFR